MAKKYIPPVLIFSILFFTSCRSSRPLTNSSGSAVPKITVVSTGNAVADYINTYKDIAIHEMERTGVPASITLAQGMIESNYGRSVLARIGNNHFGIKCHNWTGQVMYHDDDKKNDCFRRYRSPEESFIDHSDFLRNGSRYSFLFSLPADDYKGWARGLKKAGYATNPSYADMLIRKIEEENLHVFDNPVALKKASVINTRQDKISDQNGSMTATISDEVIISRPVRVLVTNRIEYIIVRDGDTRDKIEKEFGLLKWELPKYNELDNEFSPMPGQILYLQPKRDKAEAGKENYTTIEGDTMYSIAQKFGIKLKSLYEMNRIDQGVEPAPGTRLWLRSMKPVY